MPDYKNIEAITKSVIIGEEIVSVGFVEDYVVVDFANGTINFYTLPVLVSDEREYRYCDYKDSAIFRDFAGRVVIQIDITDEVFYLGLSENKNIHCFLGSEEREIPEEVEFGSHGVWWII